MITVQTISALESLLTLNSSSIDLYRQFNVPWFARGPAHVLRPDICTALGAVGKSLHDLVTLAMLEGLRQVKLSFADTPYAHCIDPIITAYEIGTPEAEMDGSDLLFTLIRDARAWLNDQHRTHQRQWKRCF